MKIKSIRQLLLATLMFLGGTPFSANAGPPPGQTWDLIWSDEFDGASLDTTKWGYGITPWGSESHSPVSLITPEDTYLVRACAVGPCDGVLVNRTRMGDFVGGSGTHYNFSAGWVWSKTWLTYGYVEIRAKYPNGKGQWPAFWMLMNGWPPEIDVAEYRGPSRNYMTEAFAWSQNCPSPPCWSTTNIPDTGGSFTGWHSYGLEWGPGYLKWYIDDVLKKTVARAEVPPAPMYIILSAGLDSSADETTGFPNYYVIDYFRWYQVARSTAPDAPTSLIATTGDNQVTLNWTAPADAPSYNIKRATVSGGPYAAIASGTFGSTYADTTAVDGTTYYYVVSAVNAFGESADSAETSSWPLSQGQPATASSFQSGHDPSQGNDGNILTRWTAANATFPQWWKVDLGSLQSINHASINWYSGATRSYQYLIEGSDDDVTYTTIVDQAGRTATGDSTDTFSASARYVRITVTGSGDSGGWAAFFECQIW